MSELPKTLWWKNPWVLGTLGGLVFITIIRPCTRHVPPAPQEIVHLSSLNLPNQIKDAWMGETGIVYIAQEFERSHGSEFDRKPIQRVAEGVDLWAKPVALHTLSLEGGDSSGSEKWTEWQVSEEVLKGVFIGLPPLKDNDSKGLFLVLSSEGSVCSISPGTKDGGIEAFHKSMRLIMDKNLTEE